MKNRILIFLSGKTKKNLFTLFLKSAAKAACDDDFNIKRHVVAGKYSESSLTNGKQPTSLDVSALSGTVEEGKIQINGVSLLDDWIQADASLAYTHYL